MIAHVSGDQLFATPAVLSGLDTIVDIELQKSVDKIATAGWELHNFLSQDPAFKQILTDIESLPPNKKVVIHTDRCFIPWKILYPEETNWEWVESNDRAPANPQLFWGYQQLIEIRLLKLQTESDAKSKNYRKVKRPGKFVSLNVAPALEKDLARIGEDVKWTHLDFFKNSITPKRGEFTDVPDRIKTLLMEKQTEASLIYFYCHGSNEKPFQEGAREKLELAEGVTVDTNFIPLQPPFFKGPVVFLNSCSSGAFSPLSFVNFHRKFKAVGARGMIVTDFLVPILVGAVIGQNIIKSFLGGIPLGRALLDLTRALLDQNNPVGLFYSLQCPMDFSAEEEKEVA